MFYNAKEKFLTFTFGAGYTKGADSAIYRHKRIALSKGIKNNDTAKWNLQEIKIDFNSKMLNFNLRFTRY